MTTFSLTDSEKTISLSAGVLHVDDAVMLQLYASLSGLNKIAALASATLSGTTSTLSFKDSRSFAFTISMGSNPPASVTFSLATGSSQWSDAEFAAIKSLGQMIMSMMLTDSLTQLSVNYS